MTGVQTCALPICFPVTISVNTGKLVIDLSSIDPEVTRQLASELHNQCSMAWVDAPVSGGTAGAEQGSLSM